MKRYLVISVLLIFLCGESYSQSLNIFSIDPSNFPRVKAKFYAFDSAGAQIYLYDKNKAEIFENNIQRSIIDLKCPAPSQPAALSAVLVMDVSGSMGGGNLILAKEAAKAWIKAIPLGQSEVAVTAFNNSNFYVQDFSTDTTVLLQKVNLLTSFGGTDYNAALLDPVAGGIIAAKKGLKKRVIVLLTDGLPNNPPNTQQIINEAVKEGITIYSVTLGMSCPQELKDISTQTGGLWYESVTQPDDAKRIYLEILKYAQGSNPCEIEWESGVNCELGNTFVKMKIPEYYLEGFNSYMPPASSVARLTYNPVSMTLNNIEPGIKKDTSIFVTAVNQDFMITNVISSNPSFIITPTKFNLNKGQSVEVKISFIPPDSGYTFTKIQFVNNHCNSEYFISGGFAGIEPKIRTLKLIHPNGGEVFVVGNDTIITWEGVTPEEPVTIDYSTDNGKTWRIIADSAKGLKYNWRIPKTPSDLCLARVTAKVNQKYWGDDMVLIPAGTFQMGNTGSSTVDAMDKPAHTVTITRDFLMNKYEVIQKKYFAVMGTNPSPTKGDSIPVEEVTWYEAIEYCNKISLLEGLTPCYSGSGNNIVCDFDANGYRLPTEAEWEYACKAGTTTDTYNGDISGSGCSNSPKLDQIAYYCGNTSKPQKIGKKVPNKFGLYDMLGNVCEWCWDWVSGYSTGAQTDPTGASSGSNKSVRGGSYVNKIENVRSSNRFINTKPSSSTNIGFRLVKTKI